MNDNAAIKRQDMITIAPCSVLPVTGSPYVLALKLLSNNANDFAPHRSLS
jgi:hypothetical protein